MRACMEINIFIKSCCLQICKQLLLLPENTIGYGLVSSPSLLHVNFDIDYLIFFVFSVSSEYSCNKIDELSATYF